MEDRFKFRFYDTKNEIMIDEDTSYEQVVSLYRMDEWWWCIEAQFPTILDYFDDKENFKIMQCTGLKDKNDKLIYEGDIVEILKIGYTNYIQKIMIVKWYQNQSSFRLFDIEALGATPQKLIEKRAMGAIDTMEVIGNIYENPELLKEIN